MAPNFSTPSILYKKRLIKDQQTVMTAIRVIHEIQHEVKTKQVKKGYDHKIIKFRNRNIRGIIQVFNRVDPIEITDVDPQILKKGGLRIIISSSLPTKILEKVCRENKIKFLHTGLKFHSKEQREKDQYGVMRVNRGFWIAQHKSQAHEGLDFKIIEEQDHIKCSKCDIYLDVGSLGNYAPKLFYNIKELANRILYEMLKVRGNKRKWQYHQMLKDMILRRQARDNTISRNQDAPQRFEPSFIRLSDFLLTASPKDPPM